MVKDVRELEVFRRAYDLSLVIRKASLGFPRHEQFGGMADQLRRSSKSVCANLVEGSGRRTVSNVEFRRFLTIAIGSTAESSLWCDYARDLGYAEAAVAASWIDEYAEIARMLRSLQKHLSNN